MGLFLATVDIAQLRWLGQSVVSRCPGVEQVALLWHPPSLPLFVQHWDWCGGPFRKLWVLVSSRQTLNSGVTLLVKTGVSGFCLFCAFVLTAWAGESPRNPLSKYALLPSAASRVVGCSDVPANALHFFFFFWEALWSYYSHTVQCTHLKCTIQ